MIFIEMLSYPFLARAMLVGVLVSLCAALLGTPLVLKRYSMIGDGLSHVGFGSLAIATALDLAPLAVTVPVVALAAVLLLRISQSGKIRGDAAIALISSGSLAVGVIVVSLTSGMNMNVSNYMFGSILTVSRADAVLSVVLCAAVIALFTLLYNRIFAVTFDETFAAATGTRAQLYNTLLAVLTAVTVVLGMRMMGALLICSLLIFPSLSAMRVFRTFKSVTVRHRHGGQLRARDAVRRERRRHEHPRLRPLRARGEAAAQIGRLCTMTGRRPSKSDNIHFFSDYSMNNVYTDVNKRNFHINFA